MPLTKTVVPIALRGGVDTKTDEKQVVEGKLLELENAVFTRPGRLQKRNGFSTLKRGDEPAMSEGRALALFSDELLGFDADTAYSYSEELERWVPKKKFRSCHITKHPVSASSFFDSLQDGTCHASGLRAFVWERSSDTGISVYYAVTDETGTQIIVPPTLLDANGLLPRVVAVDNAFVFFHLNASDGLMYVNTLPVSSPGDSVSSVAITEGGVGVNAAQSPYDVCTSLDGKNIFLAFTNKATPKSLSLWRLSGARPDTASARTTVDDLDDPWGAFVSVFIDNVTNGPVVLYTQNGQIAFRSYEPDLVDEHGTPLDYMSGILDGATPQANVVTGVSLSSTVHRWQIFYSRTEGSDFEGSPRVGATTVLLEAGAMIGGHRLLSPHESIASKAFEHNGHAFVCIVHASKLQTTYFIIDEEGQVFARFLYGVAGGVAGRQILAPRSFRPLPSITSPRNETFLLPLRERSPLSTGQDAIGVVGVTIEFGRPRAARAFIGRATHLASGMLCMYDGASVVEHGFNLFPEAPEAHPVSPGSSFVYQYMATYEWIDGQGQVHLSAPSIGFRVDTGAPIDEQAGVSISFAGLAFARPGTRVVFYRTTDKGTVFRRVGNAPNNPDVVTLLDEMTDGDLLSQPQIYTTGGVIENIAAPTTSIIATHRNRLFLVDAMNPLRLWFSKIVQPGVPVEFSDAFTMDVDPRGGDVTGLASLDDKLIVFKRSDIFFITGLGPDDTGGQNDFSDAALITTGVGCVNPHSIVTVPQGLMFASAKGIYLLDRSLSVSPVGAEVEAHTKHAVTSAVLLEDTNEVRFTLDNGTALVFDFLVGQWSVFTNVEAVDSVMWRGRHTYLRDDGRALVQTPGIFDDDGAHIPMKIVTSWLSFAGLQGFQRVYKALLLGEHISPHKLTVKVGYDFDPAPKQEVVVEPVVRGHYGGDPSYGDGKRYGGDSAPYQWRVFPSRQKCQAIQFTVEDAIQGEPGASMSLSAVTLEVGLKSGANRVRAANSAGRGR